MSSCVTDRRGTGGDLNVGVDDEEWRKWGGGGGKSEIGVSLYLLSGVLMLNCHQQNDSDD